MSSHTGWTDLEARLFTERDAARAECEKLREQLAAVEKDRDFWKSDAEEHSRARNHLEDLNMERRVRDAAVHSTADDVRMCAGVVVGFRAGGLSIDDAVFAAADRVLAAVPAKWVEP